MGRQWDTKKKFEPDFARQVLYVARSPGITTEREA